MRTIEFLLVAALGFAIYLGYVEREGQSAHFVYLVAVLTAAAANTLMLQAFDLYSVPSLSAFIRSFARIGLAWSLVMAGLMAGAFFGKVGADFSRVWMATWYVSALLMLFGERLVLSQLVRDWIREGRLNRRAVIVGGGAEAEELIKALEASHDTDIRIAGDSLALISLRSGSPFGSPSRSSKSEGWSERGDLNSRPPVPQTGALTELRYAPKPLLWVDLDIHARAAETSHEAPESA